MFTITQDDLWKAWRALYSGKPKRKRKYSRGVDNVSVEDFKDRETEYINEIYCQLKGGFFKFKPLKEYLKPRPGKEPRLIQAPTVTDRIVQKVISDHLMKQFLNLFKKSGIIGSVQGTSIKKALNKALNYHTCGLVYLLKTDIKNYYPTIDPKRMRKIFYRHVHDRNLRVFLMII